MTLRASNEPRRVAVVTGGSEGIGKEIALGLARLDRTVILVARDREKGQDAATEIRKNTNNPEIYFISANLSLLSEINRLADQIERRWPAVHYLVHSAGIILPRRTLTEEGVESHFAVNYLSRFRLTKRLLPLMQVAGCPGAAARIVIVGGAARHGRIRFDDVNLTTNFSLPRAVLQFQAANDVFTQELARRLRDENGSAAVTVNCLKLGPVKTNILRNGPTWLKWLTRTMAPFIGQTPQQAATAALAMLTSADFEGVTGALFLKTKRFRRIEPSSRTADPEAGRQLWDLSVRLKEPAALRQKQKTDPHSRQRHFGEVAPEMSGP